MFRYISAFTSCLLLGVAGCASIAHKAGPPALPPYIHTIAIRPFANHTQQYGLEDKLTLAVQSEFNLDGRYRITTEDQADGVVIGDIAKYILEPLSYDANHVPNQYRLQILVNLTFHDKVKNLTLWTEPNMTGELNYYVASSGLPGSMSEEEAREEIWDQLSKDIRARTLEGIGAVTGASSPDQFNRNSSPAEPNSGIAPPVPGAPASPSPTQTPY